MIQPNDFANRVSELQDKVHDLLKEISNLEQKYEDDCEEYISDMNARVTIMSKFLDDLEYEMDDVIDSAYEWENIRKYGHRALA